ncbi:antibiotic biosynthesis monooxygenase [Streptomyces gobiensis]|uniref:antibiotic biosynthesis monooxygenase n=1 Tax=Streptomyces gobiensis TaxID=2875706 RepID=UPI001E479EA6|nr:antibiotic biosynthesis monooxygenase [Streptomyces gobiensis]UGY90991.1 antibiotic biosynthesis monooxygenase [Streptomyces gobiensis]
MSAPRTADDDQVSAVFTWNVEPGKDAEFERWAHGIHRAAAAFPGQQGVTWLRPDNGSRRYHAVVRFRDTESLERWMESPERADWLHRLQGIATAAHPHLTTTGMESWFTVPGGVAHPPARWKMVLVTVLGVYPFVLAYTGLVTPLLPGWPLALKAALLPLFLSPMLTYVVMPWLSRAFRRWLYPND